MADLCQQTLTLLREKLPAEHMLLIDWAFESVTRDIQQSLEVVSARVLELERTARDFERESGCWQVACREQSALAERLAEQVEVLSRERDQLLRDETASPCTCLPVAKPDEQFATANEHAEAAEEQHVTGERTAAEMGVVLDSTYVQIGDQLADPATGHSVPIQPPAAKPPASTGVDRVAAVLEFISNATTDVSQRQIADATDMHVSYVSTSLKKLMERGDVIQTQKYHSHSGQLNLYRWAHAKPAEEKGVETTAQQTKGRSDEATAILEQPVLGHGHILEIVRRSGEGHLPADIARKLGLQLSPVQTCYERYGRVIEALQGAHGDRDRTAILHRFKARLEKGTDHW